MSTDARPSISTAPATTAVPRTLPVMIGAGTLSTALMTVGQYVDTPYRAGSNGWALQVEDGGGPGMLLVILALAVVGGGVVGLLVQRWSTAPRADRRSLGLALTGVLTVPVFWTGLPVALGAGAALLATRTRTRTGAWTASTAAAAALGGLLLVSATGLAVTG